MAHITPQAIARIAVSFSAAGLMALGTALPSFADSTSAPSTANMLVNAGGLGAGVSFASFVPITLNGSAQKPTTTLLLTNIIDSSGSGAGWHLELQMTQFRDAGTNTLALGSLTLTNTPIVSLQDQSSSPLSTITRGAGLTALAPIDLGGSINTSLLVAAAAGGMGSYNVAPVELTLDLPATTKSANYASIATVTMTVAP